MFAQNKSFSFLVPMCLTCVYLLQGSSRKDFLLLGFRIVAHVLPGWWDVGHCGVWREFDSRGPGLRLGPEVGR